MRARFDRSVEAWALCAEYYLTFGVWGFFFTCGRQYGLVTGARVVYDGVSFMPKVNPLSFVRLLYVLSTVEYLHSISTVLVLHDAPSVVGSTSVLNTCGMLRVHRIYRVVIGSVIHSTVNHTCGACI